MAALSISSIPANSHANGHCRNDPIGADPKPFTRTHHDASASNIAGNADRLDVPTEAQTAAAELGHLFKGPGSYVFPFAGSLGFLHCFSGGKLYVNSAEKDIIVTHGVITTTQNCPEHAMAQLLNAAKAARPSMPVASSRRT